MTTRPTSKAFSGTKPMFHTANWQKESKGPEDSPAFLCKDEMSRKNRTSELLVATSIKAAAVSAVTRLIVHSSVVCLCLSKMLRNVHRPGLAENIQRSPC